MRTSLPLAAFLMLASSACSPTEPGAKGYFEIVHGTSFNMCVGYCTSVLVIDGTTARLTETSRDSSSYPRRTRSLQLTQSEWLRLRELADPEELSRVAGVHGCPDCADGGAEWIAVQMRRRAIEAKYEYRHELEPITELQTELRALRQRFE